MEEKNTVMRIHAHSTLQANSPLEPTGRLI